MTVSSVLHNERQHDSRRVTLLRRASSKNGPSKGKVTAGQIKTERTAQWWKETIGQLAATAALERQVPAKYTAVKP